VPSYYRVVRQTLRVIVGDLLRGLLNGRVLFPEEGERGHGADSTTERTSMYSVMVWPTDERSFRKKRIPAMVPGAKQGSNGSTANHPSMTDLRGFST